MVEKDRSEITGSGITRPEVPPIYATSVFSFDTLEDVDAVYEGKKRGYVYSRMANPTVVALEERLAGTEGAQGALAFSSGMAAITTTLFSLVRPGDHVLASSVLYGGTYAVFSDFLPSWGVHVEFLEDLEPSKVVSSYRENTRMVYLETISNPLMEVVDIPKICDAAAEDGVLVVVDNTFASPRLFRPVPEGADIVLESLTKYLNGHSDVTGGMAGGSTELMEKIQKMRSLLGGSLSPFEAWLVLRGLRTFPLRMEKHSENAHYLAKNLQKHPAVKKVYYPGLQTHKSYGIARKILQDGFGGMLSFELEGGEKAVSSLVKSLENVEFLPSLAAPSTTISHPAKTSHRSMPQKEREKAGITGGLLRLSGGIERPQTVWEDLKQALDQI
ncbi:MAG: trans-sulfuration enzyme family protein [Thermovirgaceae bacterium]